jgi:hypothetical protein
MQRRLVHHEEQERTMSRYPLAFLLLVLFGLLPAAQAGELGRLFYTPQQRQQLEYQESSNSSVDGSNRNYIIVNGVVQKQGGNRIVWINGAPQAAGRGNDKTPASVPVTVPGKSQPVQLKVGQRLLLGTPAQNNTGETKSEKTVPAKPVAEEDD